MTSPMKAMAKGMIQPVARPQASRAAIKVGECRAPVPQAITINVENAAAMLTHEIFAEAVRRSGR